MEFNRKKRKIRILPDLVFEIKRGDDWYVREVKREDEQKFRVQNPGARRIR